MQDGWIKMYRSLEDWQWYDKSEMVHIFLHLMLNACVSTTYWHGREILRGQVITGRKKISAKTGISEQTVRTCLQRLQDTGEITIETTKQYSVVTITKYDTYQNGDSGSNQQLTNKEPSYNSPPKPKKTKEEIKAETAKRMQAFYNSLVPYLQTYPKQMIREFYDYWSETNKSGSKMKWEQEPTWVLEKRLDRWAKNDKSYNSKSNGTDSRQSNSTAEQRTANAASNITSFILDD